MPARPTGWPGAGPSGVRRTLSSEAPVSPMLFQDGPYEAPDDLSEASAGSAVKDLVLTSLNARRLEEARIRGWGARSLDLGDVTTIHGPTLYQLRALLFARSQITSLCLPALPDAEQVYNGVNMPSLERLVVRCRFAEHPDIIGTLQAFANNPAHANVRTLALKDAYVLPRAIGRLDGNTPLRFFLRQLSHFEISGRTQYRRGEAGASRHLLRFIAAMPALVSLSYEGYVPGMPAFQVVRIALATHAQGAPPLQHLSISQLSHEGSLPFEDAHLHRQLCNLSPHSGPALRLALGVALDAPELTSLGSGVGDFSPRLAALDLTLTPDALLILPSVVLANRDSLRELRINVLPAAHGEETASIWRAFANAVGRSTQLDVVHFAPMLPQCAPPDAPAQIVNAASDAIEVIVHAPGCATPEDARKVYIAALNAAEGARQLQRLELCVSDGPVDEEVEILRARLARKIGTVELARSRSNDGDYSPVPLLNPKNARWLWPIVFLLKPWVTNTLIVVIVAFVLTFLTLAAFGIALVIVRSVSKTSKSSKSAK